MLPIWLSVEVYARPNSDALARFERAYKGTIKTATVVFGDRKRRTQLHVFVAQLPLLPLNELQSETTTKTKKLLQASLLSMLESFSRALATLLHDSGRQAAS